MLPVYSMIWRERIVVPAERLVALPREADRLQLSMLRINGDAKKARWAARQSLTTGVVA
ncbi:hypothetical protein [Rhizobium dioscoreae]|nr:MULTISPECIES: hypothetical protein [Rhizobium]